MNTNEKTIPRTITIGICFSLLAILSSFVLGSVFGLSESSIKEYLNKSGTVVLQSVYQGDLVAKEAVVKKSWEYLQRAHVHSGAIGTAALGTILTLVILCRLEIVAKISALFFGIGAIVYPLFWLFAGFAAPSIGSTSVAKEALSYIAIPGSALCILGLCGTIYCVAKDRLFPVKS